MELSRRGFLGGCFAALALKAIPAANAIREPRFWKRAEFQWAFDPRQTREIGRWWAARNDGMLFTAVTVLWTEDLKGVRPDQEHQLRLSLKEECRMVLNSFLESDCACSPGYFCPRHKRMEPKEYAAEELEEAA